MLGSALICTLQCLMTGLLTCLSVSPEDSKYLKGREGLPLIQWSTQATEEGEEEDAKMTGGGGGQSQATQPEAAFQAVLLKLWVATH